MTELLREIGNVILWVTTIAFSVLVVYYWRVARWWKSAIGRYLQIDNIFFAIVFTFSLLAANHLSLTALLWIRIVIYIGAGALAIARLILIASAQLHLPDKKEKVNDTS